MGSHGQGWWNGEQSEESYPLSAHRTYGQRLANAGSTEYNPYFYSQSAGGLNDYTIHSPPPARQNTSRIASRPTTGGRESRSPYEALPTGDTSYALPSNHDPLPDPHGYNADSYYNPPAYHPPGSIAPSTNNVSMNDGVSVNNEFATPLTNQQKFNVDDYGVHDFKAPNDNPYRFDADALINRFSNNMHLKRIFHHLGPKFFHERAWFSWASPHSYQLPGQYYRSGNGGRINIYRHRDVFRRKYAGLNDDRYLEPLDGRVEKLFVQTVNEIYDTDNDTTWRRTYIKNVSPWLIRLAYWPYSHMPVATPEFAAVYDLRESSSAGIGAWEKEQWFHVGLRWLPSCLGLLLLMIFPTDVEGQVRNHGCYDPVPYRYWSYPLSARNFRENKGQIPKPGSFGTTNDFRLSDRCLRPRLLCFLDRMTDDDPRGCLDPQVWIAEHGGGVEPTYIFISYTAENQFERRCADARRDIQSTGSSYCNCLQCQNAASDAEALHRIARKAARNANVAAYWTDQCCMSTDKAELQEDVYRISDVVRGAAKIVIVVGRTGQDRLPPSVTTLGLLKEWGTRMWTWPEVLLGPAGEKIQVYTRGGDMHAPLEISKMEFPAQVWDDGDVARQLIDNFEGSLTLSRLELVILALECLKHRVEKGTTKYLEGDLSYALMGLLRQRPKVEQTDSALQAFARLSLANDSDRLLERMICLLPFDDSHDPIYNERYYNQNAGTAIGDNSQYGKGLLSEDDKKRHYWTNLDDYWGAKLWDIQPMCQVAGIGKDDTVILDGAYGATVHWDSFQRVAITTRETWSRMLARYFVRGTPVWFFTGVLTVAFSPNSPAGKGIGALFLIIAIVTVLLSPMLILHIYGGKVWNTQPWLFGFEGHMSLRKIEMKIFGFPSERLSWAPYASNMSHHRVNSEFLEDECEGMDPLLAGENERSGAGMVSTTGEKLRLFTLVDTNTMTVTNFRAARPPTVALLCGSEGGMQRAVMCSYDWTNQCLWRETVLRMETMALQKMPRIGRVRFGLRRWQGEMGRSDLLPPD